MKTGAAGEDKASLVDEVGRDVVRGDVVLEDVVGGDDVASGPGSSSISEETEWMSSNVGRTESVPCLSISCFIKSSGLAMVGPGSTACGAISTLTLKS